MQNRWNDDEGLGEGANNNFRSYFKLLHMLSGHKNEITTVTWSPDGRTLASASQDGTFRIWDAENGKLRRILENNLDYPLSISWSPNGQMLALASHDSTIRLWDTKCGELRQILRGHSGAVSGAVWSPDGRKLASASFDKTIKLWDVESRVVYQTLLGHSEPVTCIAWSPDGHKLASASIDKTFRIWDTKNGEIFRTLENNLVYPHCLAFSPNGRILALADHSTIKLRDMKTGRKIRNLEGNTGYVTSISFSMDNQFLASLSSGCIRLWHCDTWEILASLDYEGSSEHLFPGPSLAFHPNLPLLATVVGNTNIHIIKADFNTLIGIKPTTTSVYYSNAKVVLVGDTGVGKSGLGLVLTGESFVPTESTHGRRVWKFDSREVKLDSRIKETRETILWDLAGQPGYRLIHQLHLNEVAVALILFDARSETDPFAGVHYWDRALRQAQLIQGESAPTLKKFLVAARSDRGGINVSRTRINSLVNELGFDGYFETSAKEGKNIKELANSICEVIDWETLPKVSSTELFQYIKGFLIAEKGAGQLLSTVNNLFNNFLKSKNDPRETKELYAQFETCIRLVESRDLIKKLSFGNLILLQPELLDAYAAAIVNQAKNEPDGMGCIAEEDVQRGHFELSKEERIKDTEQEKLLLIATIEDMLRHEIALRESSDDGMYLIFPSQFTREWSEAPDPEGKSVIFRFEGPVVNIYSTLAVRLSHSGLFTKKEMWKNAAAYEASVGGICGMFLREIEGGRGELIIFFDQAASEETRFQFEDFVQTHLQRRALPQSIHRQRIFDCPKCRETITEKQAKHRRERGHRTINCPVCETSISLLDRVERLPKAAISVVLEMDRAADAKRESETATSVLQGKIETGDFDVFLCHNSDDKSSVKQIGDQLKNIGILPWLDEWELRPGLPWQRALEQQIEHIKSAAVFVGKNGLGPWQQQELDAFLRKFVKSSCPVIPVLLPNAPTEPKLPVFLESITWVDFRKTEPDPLEQLIWGITGERKLDQRFMKK